MGSTSLLKNVLILMVVTAVFALCEGFGAARESNHTADSPGAGEPMEPPQLSAADLLPASTALMGRLSALQRNLSAGFDLSTFEKDFAGIDRQLKASLDWLKELKEKDDYSNEQLIAFKVEILTQSRSLDRISRPLTVWVTQVQAWNRAWEGEKEQWAALQSSLSKDGVSGTAKQAIARAKGTIDEAKKLISTHLEPLLATEHKVAEMRARMDSALVEADNMLHDLRSDWWRRAAPSIFSPHYYAQFNKELWSGVTKGLAAVSWSERQALERNLAVISLQVLVWLALTVAILRHRAALAAEERLRFVAERPFAAGVFAGFVFFIPFLGPTLGFWGVVLAFAVTMAVARLAARCVIDAWRRGAVYVIAALFILNEFLQVCGLPRPLFRLYVLLVALISSLFLVWRALKSAGLEDGRFYKAVRWLGVIVSVVILLCELAGFSALSAHLLEAALKTCLIVLSIWMLMALVRGFLEWVFYRSTLGSIGLVQKNARVIVHVLARLFNLFLGAAVTIVIPVAWGLYGTHGESAQAILSLGWTIGSWRVSVGYILAAGLLFYGSFLASRALRSILVEEVFPRRGVERGVQISMGRLVHYGIVLLGFLLALSALGVNFTNITIIGGALGVGIGFGLQAIVNNFVSGLILLFERPIRVGDYIEISGLWAEVKRIGLRATVVETFDRADVVVPNSDLISGQVTNWTRTNRVIRLKVPVGVAYGSDVALVIKILLETAQDNPSVLSSPKPQALFTGFGDSSLNFEVRAYLSDIDNMFVVRSEVLQEIDRAFREAGVEIPFPQRDLHLRSVEDKASESLRSSGVTGSPVSPVKKQDELE